MPGKKSQPAVIPVQCTDKTFDTTPPQDHPCSMPRGSRIAVVSDPGRGKSSLVKNCIVRSAPWAAVYIIHGMADSHEYDLIEHTKLTFEEATPEYFAAEATQTGVYTVHRPVAAASSAARTEPSKEFREPSMKQSMPSRIISNQ